MMTAWTGNAETSLHHQETHRGWSAETPSAPQVEPTVLQQHQVSQATQNNTAKTPEIKLSLEPSPPKVGQDLCANVNRVTAC